jgi:Chaperone of endosialidase
MKPVIQFKTIPPLLVALLLVCFGLAPIAQAVGPDTDGAIPGSNNGEGTGVLVSRTGGVWNSGTGFEALNHLTSGKQNTATGLRALFSDINGGFNTATGVFSLFSNTSGFFNSATGAYSLANNTNGNNNTANGYGALYRNTADNNTATGYAALYYNTTGGFNTASGVNALASNTTAISNTANGAAALQFNTVGGLNTAIGAQALFSNTTGNNNTAIGGGALFFNTTGGNNIALGSNAGSNLATGHDNIDIGNVGIAGDSSTIRIGDTVNAKITTFIAGISTAPVTGTPVVVAGNGQLGVAPSSARFKDEIKPMDQASEAVLALKPVTFHYKSDKSGTPQFGLIAEEVAQVNPDLVVRDENGEIYTVRYDAVNAMLLNEFVKEHGKVQKLEAAVAQQRKDFQSTIAQQQKSLQSRLAEQEKQIEALASSLQKVKAQIEIGKPAPRVTVNNR